MTNFFKAIAFTILLVGFWFGLTAFVTALVAIVGFDLIGWSDYSDTFGDFKKYDLSTWMIFFAHTLVYAGGAGFLFGALLGHAIGWGVSLRQLGNPVFRLFVGFIGASTASFWFYALLYIAARGNRDTFFSDLLGDPTLQLVAAVPTVTAVPLIWMSYRKDWWNTEGR